MSAPSRPPPTAPTVDPESGLPAVPTERPRSSLSSFLFITFILFLLTSHNGGSELMAQERYRDALQGFKWTYGNFSEWVEGRESNFTLVKRDERVDAFMNGFFSADSGVELDPETESYYSNVTGYVSAESPESLPPWGSTRPPSPASPSLEPWEPLATQLMANVNLTSAQERLGTYNWSSLDKLAWSLVESRRGLEEGKDEGVVLVHGRIELSNPITGDEMRMNFEGVHFVRNGSFWGLAEQGDIQPDLTLLPSLVPPPYTNITARLVSSELGERIRKVEDSFGRGDEMDQPPSCSYILRADLKKTPHPLRALEYLEEEILNPTGVTTIKPPKIEFGNIVLVSVGCGIGWEVKGEGVRSRVWFRKVTTYAASTALIYLTLLLLLSRQMDRSRTPSALGKLSRWGFLVGSLVDAVVFAGHITFAIVAEGQPSLSLVAPAFLACMLFVNEAQFALLIHQIQAPEDAVTPPPAPPMPTPIPAGGGPGVVAGTLPSVAPAPGGNANERSFLRGYLNHMRTDPQARLWLSLSILVTFIIRTIIYPPLALFLLAGMYASMWVPQIVRSARRGRESGLGMEYVVGTTVGRLAVAFYFLWCPRNVLDVEPRGWVFLLAAFLLVQVLVLYLQQQLGPSFFMPKRWAQVPTYDYHPSIPLPDPEAPEQTLGDCSICMDAILIDPSSRRRSGDEKRRKSSSLQRRKSFSDHRGKSGGEVEAERFGGHGGLLGAVSGNVGRKSYSLAPCHHLFHTECLERWLAIKNICPQCRRPLPPL
ncbi:hypothetical protein JAAARDRAFT_142065 [Jaapia argillacea MUCL 33604]|uniref:RING-type E3 ubiquitin transferase n=1 Tax=Jaapia argillacea MUCL 33604 TaxID=933084 RepID=A0A067PHI1_9AGAM|nr:hypothetical protein JAAARDRAFT_142065 [Jaapia argillacea MUCL 33604]